MKPLTENPKFKKKPKSDRDLKMEWEIEEFLKAGCEFAELWFDQNVTRQRSIELYKRICRHIKGKKK